MIDDEALTLYYYDDGLSVQRREEIASALRDDAELAARYAALATELDGLAPPSAPSAPPQAVVRWRYELDRALAAEAAPARPAVWAWPLAAAAVLVLGIVIGIHLAGDRPATPADRAAATTDASADAPAMMQRPAPRLALTRGLAAHLQSTRLQLVGLERAGAAERIDLITDIIEQNRLFERAADASDAPELARVLRAFEQMLIELAREEAAPRDISDKADQLTFEYAAMLTKLTGDASHDARSL